MECPLPSAYKDRFFVSRRPDDTFAVIDRNTGYPADVGVTSIKLLQDEAEELAMRLNSGAFAGLSKSKE